MWIIGDKFVRNNIDLHMMAAKHDKYNYTFSNFEVEYYATDELKSNNPNVLSRLRNAIFHAFNKFNRLPRLIVLIIEDDIIRNIKLQEFGVSDAYRISIKWLLREYRRAILTMREKLPKKALNNLWPHVLIMAPSVHKNYLNDKLRRKFTHILENEVLETQNNDNMTVLRLPKQNWDPEDGNLYLQKYHRYTSDGISTFWSAVDKSIRFCITNLDEAEDAQKLHQAKEKAERNDRTQMFHYERTHFRKHNNYY